MKLTIQPPKIDDEAPFDGDLFDRARFAEGLTNILKQCHDPLVIGIDGSWGEGKTTFVKMWQGHLNHNEMPSIYIDAFANDYTDNAFMVVASAIYDYAALHGEKAVTSKFLQKAKKAGTKLLPWSGKIAVKALTLGAIKEADIDDFGEIVSDLSSDLSDAAEKLIADKIASHKEDTKTIESFKSFLSELPKSFANQSPLTIIIDELDRCRPSFAVEMLEKIKHLFSVPNISFILIINKNQLEESIRASYGPNIDAHTYLQKFITIEAKLPKKSDRYGGDIRKYCIYLHNQHELGGADGGALADAAVALGEHFDVTLRQLEKIYSNLTIALAASLRPNEEHHMLLAFAATMKVVRPMVFSQLIKRTLSSADLFKALNFESRGEDDERYTLCTIMNWARYCLLTDAEYKILKDDPEINGMDRWRRGSRQDMLFSALRPISAFS